MTDEELGEVTDQIIVISILLKTQTVLGRLLRSAGYTVQVIGGNRLAMNAIDARESRARPPTLFVIELEADELDGFQVLARAKACFPDVPAIAVCGGTRNVSPDLSFELARQYGANACVRTTADGGKLLSVVSGLLTPAKRDSDANSG